MKPATTARPKKKGPARRRKAAQAGREKLELARGRRPRTRLSPEQRRMQIIDAAEELFKTRPYSVINVQDVATRAGITQGLVYHYFPTKEALFASALELRADELLRETLLDSHLPFPEQLERGVRAYVDWVEAHDVTYANLFRSAHAADETFWSIMERARQRIIDHLVQAMGLAERTLPATRASLRGHLGYSESVMLEWLRERRLERSTLERLLLASLVAALRIGLSNDVEAQLDARVLAELDSIFHRYLA